MGFAMSCKNNNNDKITLTMNDMLMVMTIRNSDDNEQQQS